MMSKIRRIPLRSLFRQYNALMAPCLVCWALTGCASSGQGVRLESLGPSFPSTIWESIEVVPSVGGVQRSFIPLAHLRVAELKGFLDNATIEALQREASRVGANAIVLAELGSEDAAAGSEDDGEAWSGVATAIRVLEGRWADRYWRYGAPPQPLEGPDVDALSPNRYPRPGQAAPGRANRGEQEREAPAPPVESVVSSWHSIVMWAGNGTERTDEFTVPSGEWRVTWQAVTDGAQNLEIMVHESVTDDLIARIDQDGIGTGSYLGLEGGGTYYLQINGEGVSWEIAIDAWVQDP